MPPSSRGRAWGPRGRRRPLSGRPRKTTRASTARDFQARTDSYRRAEEMRTVAEDMKHPETRALTFKLAETYAGLPERAYARMVPSGHDCERSISRGSH